MSTTYGARRAPSCGEAVDDLVDVERLAAGRLDLAVLGDGAGLDVGGERRRVGDVAGPQADAPGLVGVGRADALQRGADLVVAAHRLGDGVVGLVPREDQVGPARDLQPGARHAAGLEGVDLGEQRRQVDDDAVADDRHDVVVEDAARDQLQGVAVAADDDGVPGVVATLVAHDVAVLLGQQVDDLGLALVTPLGADDDGDGHGVGRTERVECTAPPDTGAPATRMDRHSDGSPVPSAMDAVMRRSMERWTRRREPRCAPAGWPTSSTPTCGRRSPR